MINIGVFTIKVKDVKIIVMIKQYIKIVLLPYFSPYFDPKIAPKGAPNYTNEVIAEK